MFVGPDECYIFIIYYTFLVVSDVIPGNISLFELKLHLNSVC